MGKRKQLEIEKDNSESKELFMKGMEYCSTHLNCGACPLRKSKDCRGAYDMLTMMLPYAKQLTEQIKVLQEEKDALVREIFEEIEKFLLNQTVETQQIRIKEVGEWILHDYLPRHFAELKKKYTKSDNCIVGTKWDFAEKLSYEQPDLSDATYTESEKSK